MEESKTLTYRDIRKFKYETVTDLILKTGITLTEPIVTNYCTLTCDGWLTVKAPYLWDGASGPTIDSKKTKRGSGAHDCLYQLIREGKLDKRWRKTIDKLFKRLLEEDGLSFIRIRVWYKSVRRFAFWAAWRKETANIIFTAP